MSSRLAFSAFSLVALASAAGAADLWTIGTADGTSAGFALAPKSYAKYLDEDFGWEDTFFLVGRDTAEKRFPYVIPGPTDTWAGSGCGAGTRTAFVNILFSLAKTGDGAARLVVDFADIHPSEPPLFKVTLNGKSRKFALPAGGSEASLTGDFAGAKPHRLVVDFAPGELREGPNELAFNSIEGRWAIFDSVRLEVPDGTVLEANDPAAYVRGVSAGDYLIPDTASQPLVVDVQHLSGAPTVRVDLDGKTIFSSKAEKGRYQFEAPMPGVDRPTGSEYEVFVDGRSVRRGTVVRTPRRVASFADYVDTRMGTAHSRWMLAPGPWMPFSMVKLAPDNEPQGWQDGYDTSVESVGTFSHIHEWTMQGLGTMPVTGPLKTKIGDVRELKGHPDGYRSYMDKSSEVCRTGYYAVRLTDYGILAELTSTTRGGFQRYTYPDGALPRVMVDLDIPGEYHCKVEDCAVEKVGPRRLEGWSRQLTDRVWSTDADQFYTVHFVLEFDRDIVSCRDVRDGKCFAVEFAPRASANVVQLRSAISYVDAAGASRNLETEIAKPFGWDFEKVRAANVKAWDDLLGRIRVKSSDRREKKRFYTNLYRSFCRNLFSDVDGRWNGPDDKVRTLADHDSRALGCDAFWNTFWNLNQVWNLVAPEWSSRWVKSQLAMYDACGWLAKGPAGMRYVPVMVAEHEIPLMVSSWQMGIRDSDPEKMLAAFVKMQTTPSRKVGRGYAGNRDLKLYLKHHYVPSGIEGAHYSNSMEYSYDDWTVGEFAKAIGRADVAATFADRGTWWKNAVNPESGYCHLRNAKGEWEKNFDPFLRGSFRNGDDYTEGNGWQLTFFVPQDVPALVEHIGRERFIERLEWGFEKSNPMRYNAPNDEFAKYPVVQGNQQSMHFAFLFSWAGEPWKTQKWARSILDRYYGYEDGNAWLGDEDQGQMSAWLVMTSLGLFQTDGGCRAEPRYEIVSPVFEEATVVLGGRYGRGKSFTVRARNASRANIYVQSAKLNGKALDSFIIPASAVLAGGELELEMGPAPSKWGLGKAAR